MQDTQLDPAEALALAERTRRHTAERGQAWWYHLGYGLGFGVMTTGLASSAAPLFSGLGLLIIVATMLVWRHRSGLGHIRHGRRTRMIAIGSAALLLGGWLFVMEAVERFGMDWAALVGGPLVGVAAALASWLIDRAWRAEKIGG